MSDCSDYPTLSDAKGFKANADTINEVVTSNDDRTSPAIDGETKLTLKGFENQVDTLIADGTQEITDAIENTIGKSYLGTWTQGATTFTTMNEYSDFNGITYKPKSGITLPYTAQTSDPTTAPDNANVEPFSDVNSSNIGSQPVISSGSTEAISISDRFAVTVNLDDFGAKGDGVTDDTLSVQSALDSIDPSNGANVIGGSGKTYKVSGLQVNTPANIINTKFLGASSSSPVIKIESSDVSIVGCTIDADDLNLPYDAGTVTQASCISLINTSGDFSNIIISGNRLLNAGRDGVYINTESGLNHIITNNLIVGASRNCVSIVSSFGGVISNNVINEWGLVGVDLETNPGTTGQIHNFSCSGNSMQCSSLSSGVSFSLGIGTGNPTTTGSNILISGNSVSADPTSDSSSSSMLNKDFTNVEFIGNVISNCSGGISSNSAYTAITGNKISGGNQYSPGTLTSKGAISAVGLISGNIIMDYPFFGIVCNGDEVTVRGNSINNVGFGVSGMSAIYLYDQLGTYLDCDISSNTMSNCDRGIYIRNSTGLSMTMIGNTYTNINTNIISSPTNYSVRLDELTFKLDNLPTSSSGLATGTIWNDAGTLKVVT